MSTQCSRFASLNIMEPALNIPVNLAAVEVSAWDGSQEDNSCVAHLIAPATPTSTVIVNLPEKVTAQNARSLIRDLRTQLNVDQPYVLLDLSDVKELDSSGLDLLLECLHETVTRDGTIRLRGISPEAATVLELTGMDQVLGLIPGPHVEDSTPETARDYVAETLMTSSRSLVA
jgi:anti-anti-sigma factor